MVAVGFRSPNDALALEDVDSRRGVEEIFSGVLGSPVKLVVEKLPAESGGRASRKRRSARRASKRAGACSRGASILPCARP